MEFDPNRARQVKDLTKTKLRRGISWPELLYFIAPKKLLGWA